MGGDWNCVLSPRDCQSQNIQVSKALLNVVRSLRCKDAWFIKNNSVEYTFARQNYGSRLDWFYVKNIANHIEKINVCHINFSDHSSIEMIINFPNLPKVGKFYWKLNVALLENEYIKESFQTKWIKIKNCINNYDTINDWWER